MGYDIWGATQRAFTIPEDDEDDVSDALTIGLPTSLGYALGGPVGAAVGLGVGGGLAGQNRAERSAIEARDHFERTGGKVAAKHAQQYFDTIAPDSTQFERLGVPGICGASAGSFGGLVGQSAEAGRSGLASRALSSAGGDLSAAGLQSALQEKALTTQKDIARQTTFGQLLGENPQAAALFAKSTQQGGTGLTGGDVGIVPDKAAAQVKLQSQQGRESLAREFQLQVETELAQGRFMLDAFTQTDKQRGLFRLMRDKLTKWLGVQPNEVSELFRRLDNADWEHINKNVSFGGDDWTLSGFLTNWIYAVYRRLRSKEEAAAAKAAEAESLNSGNDSVKAYGASGGMGLQVP